MLLPMPAFCPKKELLEPDVLRLPVPSPMNVFALPVLETPALDPKIEFSTPSVLNEPAPCPKYELKMPVVLRVPAPAPKKELPRPVVFLLPARPPKKELMMPSLPPLLQGVFDAPAPIPVNVLPLGDPPHPVTLITGWLFRLK